MMAMTRRPFGSGVGGGDSHQQSHNHNFAASGFGYAYSSSAASSLSSSASSAPSNPSSSFASRDTGGANGCKIWIGSIPASVTVDEVRRAGNCFGTVRDVHYRVDPQHQLGGNISSDRGWAFITFGSREEASAAIQSLDGSYHFSSCQRPLEARFAAAQREQQGDDGGVMNRGGTGSVGGDRMNDKFDRLDRSGAGFSFTRGGNVGGFSGSAGAAGPSGANVAGSSGGGVVDGHGPSSAVVGHPSCAAEGGAGGPLSKPLTERNVSYPAHPSPSTSSTSSTPSASPNPKTASFATDLPPSHPAAALSDDFNRERGRVGSGGAAGPTHASGRWAGSRSSSSQSPRSASATPSHTFRQPLPDLSTSNNPRSSSQSPSSSPSSSSSFQQPPLGRPSFSPSPPSPVSKSVVTQQIGAARVSSPLSSSTSSSSPSSLSPSSSSPLASLHTPSSLLPPPPPPASANSANPVNAAASASHRATALSSTSLTPSNNTTVTQTPQASSSPYVSNTSTATAHNAAIYSHGNINNAPDQFKTFDINSATQEQISEILKTAPTYPPIREASLFRQPYLWQVYTCPQSGVEFYCNSITGHTQWERPFPPIEYIEGRGKEGWAEEYRSPPRKSITQAHKTTARSLKKSTKIHPVSEKSRKFKSRFAESIPSPPVGRSPYGPPGANLFIFHIPQSWDEKCLTRHFNIFGNILSASVSTTSSGRSSGFGFVSFDNKLSAVSAIMMMDGFQVEGKALKVQLKKGEEQYLPLSIQIQKQQERLQLRNGKNFLMKENMVNHNASSTVSLEGANTMLSGSEAHDSLYQKSGQSNVGQHQINNAPARQDPPPPPPSQTSSTSLPQRHFLNGRPLGGGDTIGSGRFGGGSIASINNSINNASLPNGSIGGVFSHSSR